jgi:hypothetical protein
MNIREHPLAWRWTDPKYVEFPAEILAQISPLDASAAAAVHDRWFPGFDKYGEIIPSRFGRVEICPTEGTWKDNSCSREATLIGRVTDWLRAREPNIALPVTISWRRDCAVRTTWQIFTQWWDDFCYASSDDAFIVPDTPRWFLAFHHEDWFTFCHDPSAYRS